MTAPLEPAERD